MYMQYFCFFKDDKNSNGCFIIDNIFGKILVMCIFDREVKIDYKFIIKVFYKYVIKFYLDK